MNIAIIDDDVALLDYLKQELENIQQVKILFTAKNGLECLESLALLSAHQQPNIVLMDISMPILDGIQSTKQITEKYPNIQIVMLTTFEDDDKILACIQAGAKGYLLKTEKFSFILQTLEEVNLGGSQMSPSIARRVFYLLQQEKHIISITNEEDKLTSREKEILVLVKEGKKYKKISDLLFISEETVKKHIRNIYKKFSVNNKIEAIHHLDL
ncbi:MAG: DNA-binding response regulator [Bacteroidetes bacterium]|nr:MAG: DNA-binding response regulator [Bacteroidota bacterium]TAG88380.1 MAG: DNA-binding response regulator [Bacteroidota bacterium]